MSPKRGDRVAAPPVGEEWDIRFTDSDSARGWADLCRQVPANTREAFEAIRTNPRPFPHAERQHRLHGDHAVREFRGREVEQWQYEVTGAGRIWYLVDEAKHVVWVTWAGTGHPKKTE